MKKFLALSLSLSVLILTGCERSPAVFDDLAQCMTDNGAVMYGSDTCPHCKQQKTLFKGSFDLIDYVECRKDPKACQEAGIQNYPTWIIDGERHEGTTSLTELAGLTNCAVHLRKKTTSTPDTPAPEAVEEAAEESAE